MSERETSGQAAAHAPLWQRPWRWLTQAWADIDAQAAADRAADARSAGDAQRARVLLVVAATLLALGYSFGDRPCFETYIAPQLPSSLRNH